MPRWKRNSLAGSRGTKWEEKWLSLPEQGGIHWACGKSSARCQGLHSLPGSRHRGIISQARSIQCHQCGQQTPSSSFPSTHKPEPAFHGTVWVEKPSRSNPLPCTGTPSTRPGFSDVQFLLRVSIVPKSLFRNKNPFFFSD